MSELDPGVRDYFSRPDTVGRWWTPEEGPLRFHYEAEVRVIEQHLTLDSSVRVLDLGTGRGRFGIWFARRGCRVVGIDVNPEMLAAARARAHALGLEDRFDLRQGDAEDLSDFADGTFDLVLCMELFDHVPVTGTVLAEVRRVLAPGGRLIFTYVPGESLYGVLGNAYRWWRRRSGETIISRTYRLPEIRNRLEEHGLRLDRYWGIGVLCLTAQTRLFQAHWLFRGLTALARAEATVRPYYAAPWLARRGSHVVGFARVADGGG